MRERKRKAIRRYKVPLFFKILVGLALVAIVLCGFDYYIRTNYEIKNVYVDGNVHYTDEQIKEIVMSQRFGNNSFYLSRKYKNKSITDVPFIEAMDVKVEAPDTIRILVYEKTLAGFVEYLGRYIYFDKDGIVVESSLVKTQGVPEVVGVKFDYVVVHEKLPAKDDKLFQNVLDVTKLMTKYEFDAEKMYFKPNGDIVLYKGDIIISLGSFENLDIKIMNLSSMVEKLSGRKGTLRMEDYTEDTKKISFEPEATQKADEAKDEGDLSEETPDTDSDN